MHRVLEESSDEEDGEMKSRTPVMKVYKNKMPNKVNTTTGGSKDISCDVMFIEIGPQAKPQKTAEGDTVRKRKLSIQQPTHHTARMKELHMYPSPPHHP